MESTQEFTWAQCGPDELLGGAHDWKDGQHSKMERSSHARAVMVNARGVSLASVTGI